MEEKNDRALAYTLAQSIHHDELGYISGGKMEIGGLVCSKETLRASGVNGRVNDAGIDVTVDW
jgi:hypothetical protein